jgi:hypothetical protein
MSAASVARWVSLAAAVSCAGPHNTAPGGWLPKPAETQADAYGGWIELTYKKSMGPRRIAGELIAVSADSVWVLNDTAGMAIPTSAVHDGKLTAYAAQTGNLTTWTLLGALSTLSNGALLVFTAPMWLIGGSLTVRGEARSPERKQPPLGWNELAPYARFPQGLPEGLQLTALRPKKDYGPAHARP